MLFNMIIIIIIYIIGERYIFFIDHKHQSFRSRQKFSLGAQWAKTLSRVNWGMDMKIGDLRSQKGKSRFLNL